MMLGRSHAPPDCNLSPPPPSGAQVTSIMFLPSARMPLPNFASRGRRRPPVRRDLCAGLSIVQCNLCLDTKSLEQLGGARPTLMGRALSPPYDAFRMLIAGVSASLLAIFIVASPPPARSRSGLLEAAEARPILHSPERRIAQKVPHGVSGFPYLPFLCTAFPALIQDTLLFREVG